MRSIYDELDDRCKRIVVALKDLQPRTSSYLAKVTGIPQRTVIRHLEKHLEHDKIAEKNIEKGQINGKQLSTQMWRLTAEFVMKHGDEIGIEYKIIVDPPKLTATIDEEFIQFTK